MNIWWIPSFSLKETKITSIELLEAPKIDLENTNEIGIYEMFEDGLKGVKSPNKLLISENTSELSGIAIGCSLKGSDL